MHARSGWRSTTSSRRAFIIRPPRRSFTRSARRIPRISLATVYKALEALVAIGAVHPVDGLEGTGSARYDARREDHYHFRCLRTGTVHDLPTRFDPDLIAKLDPALAENLRRARFSR